MENLRIATRLLFIPLVMALLRNCGAGRCWAT